MGRKPCCGDDEAGAVKKGPWTTEEDRTLVDYIRNNGGHGSWRRLPRLAGLNRCGKSCRLRWTNYLRPDIKRGGFTDDDDKLIIHLHSLLGNKWSAIAARLPGRTDNEIKNYWNTHLRKKLLAMGIDPVTHRPYADVALIPSLLKLQADAANLANLHLLQGLLTSVLGTAGAPASPPPLPNVDLMALLGAALLATGGGGQYDGLSNLQALTSAAAPTMPELVLDGFGIGATTGLGDATDLAELGQGASCGNMTMPVAAAAPALVETLPDSCTVGGGGTDKACSSPASSSFEGLEQSLSYLDELRADGGWKDLLEQMSLFNSPQYEDI